MAFRSSTARLNRLHTRADKAQLVNFDPYVNLKRTPTYREFAEISMGAPLDPWQMAYLASAPEHNRIAIAASRQSGKSTVTAMFIGWCLVFIPNFMVLVASRSLRQASHFLQKVRDAVLTFIPPDAMRQMNRLSMELPNGASIVSIPCAQPDAGRGFSPHMVLLDEAAFAPEDLFTAILPSLAATHGAMHMISSPNGRQGRFFDAFEGESKGVYWSQRVTYKDCPRMTEEQMELERRALGDLAFRQEFLSEFISPLGAFFAAQAIESFEETQEAGDYSSLELADLEALAVEEFGDPAPGVDDLKAAYDKMHRVQERFYVD